MSAAAHHTAERILVAQAASILGLPPRTVQDAAAKGSIPSAAKILGRWTFDERRLRAWVREREVAACPAIYTSAGPRGGAALRSTASSIDEAFEQALGLRQ